MAQTTARRDPVNPGGSAAPVLSVVRSEGAPARPAIRALRFGDFELDATTGELARGGEPVKLQPQPAKLLQYLAERSGQALSRRELQLHLWGENRFVDSEQGLNYCVKSIRRALGDRAGSPTYLETIPRRGYRFRAPVTIVDGRAAYGRARHADPDTPGSSMPDAAPAVRTPAVGAPAVNVPTVNVPTVNVPDVSRRLWGLGIVAVAVAAGWALWRPAPGGEGPPRIAVLPLVNLSEQAGDAPLLDGLTAELISRLVRGHGKELGVIAQSSVAAYAGRRSPVGEIGSELDVDFVVTGSFRRSGQASVLSTQLIEVAGETVRWAEVVEGGAGAADWGAWTARVAAAVAGELGLPPASPALPAFDLPAELYEVYLEGIAFSNLETEEGLRRGLETLDEVRRRAPGFAPAHLAWARLRARTGAASEFLPGVMAALERAVALDPDFAEAHLEITRLRGLYLYEWRRGAEHVRRALELRPRLADAHIVHAMYLAAAGEVEEAIAAMHRALVIDPLSGSTSVHVAWSYFFARRYEEAIEASRRTLEIDPASTAAHSTIIHSLIQLGDVPGALDQARRMTGRELADLDELWRSRIERGANPGVVAIWQTQLGEHEAALDHLMRACRERVGWPLPFLRVDARFDALRGHPRFADVLACTGLAD